MASNIKLDKETLVKHRFWIALGVFVPLWLVSWLVLWLSVSDAVEAKKVEYQKSVTAIEGVKDPKTTYYTNPMNEKKGTLVGRKDTLWSEVWNTQGNLMADWPFDNKTPQLAAMANAPFGSPIKDDDKLGITATSVRQEYRDFLYKAWRDKKQEEFAFWAGPITLDFENVIAPAHIEADANYTPTDEEIWLNAETVWVKRELLWTIRQTLDRLAYFEPVTAAGEEKLPAEVVARRRFRNSNWELDLLFKPGTNRQLVISKDSTIKNVNSAKRTLPLREVKVWLAQTSASDPSKTVNGPTFTIQGEPVPWNKTASIGQDVRVDNFGFKENQPTYATQVFTWSTSPIKQIDWMELGYQSSRTTFQELRGLKDEAAGGTTTTSQPATGAGGKMGGVAGGNEGAATKGGETTLGINLKRYVQVTPQVRRMPVAINMTIDQACIEDLVSHFVNSRLRFQPTQVQWQQDMRGIKPPDPDAPKEAGAGAVAGAAKPGAGKPGAGKPGAGRAGGPGGGAGMGSMMAQQNQMIGAMRGGGAGQGPNMGQMMGVQGQIANMMGGAMGGIQPGGAQPGGPGAPVVDESDPNLVEFVLSGIISLYDRYQPSAPPGTQQGAAAPAATAPAAGAAPPTAGTAPPQQVDQPKADGTPKPAEAAKPDEPKEAAPKADDKKGDEKKADDKKADDKKANDKPAGGDAKKAGENKGN